MACIKCLLAGSKEIDMFKCSFGSAMNNDSSMADTCAHENGWLNLLFGCHHPPHQPLEPIFRGFGKGEGS